MNELSQWGIMTDWRYSYFTMQPEYQAMVLREFGNMMKKRVVYWGDRPALWSVKEQKILAEEEFEFEKEIIDCAVMKLPIRSFGVKAENIRQLYPDAKVLVFATEPWKIMAMKGVCLNENITYTLAKWKNEYVILATKRIGELMMRTGAPFN